MLYAASIVFPNFWAVSTKQRQPVDDSDHYLITKKSSRKIGAVQIFFGRERHGIVAGSPCIYCALSEWYSKRCSANRYLSASPDLQAMAFNLWQWQCMIPQQGAYLLLRTHLCLVTCHVASSRKCTQNLSSLLPCDPCE